MDPDTVKPVDSDYELLIYDISTIDGRQWYLKILGNGGDKVNFTILKTHPEVFDWEDTQGMLKLKSNKNIDPKIIIEAIKSDPIDSVSIIKDLQEQEDITSEFITNYSDRT